MGKRHHPRKKVYTQQRCDPSHTAKPWSSVYPPLPLPHCLLHKQVHHETRWLGMKEFETRWLETEYMVCIWLIGLLCAVRWRRGIGWDWVERGCCAGGGGKKGARTDCVGGALVGW